MCATHRFKTKDITIDPGEPRSFISEADKSFILTLGTGTPSPNPFRFGPAGAVIAGEIPYLIDAGEGIIRAIAKAAGAHAGRFADCFAPKRLNTLFITHLHSDHITGLASLLLNTWIFGRDTPMRIFGPKGTKEMIEHLIEAHKVDIDDRLNSLDPASPEGCKVEVTEIEEGLIYTDENVTVEAVRHPHGYLDNFGFKFTTEDKSIFWCGDGQVSESFTQAARDVDVMVVEVCTEENIHHAHWGGLTDEEREDVIWSYHMRPSVLGPLTQKAGVKRVVMIHESNYSQPYEIDSLYRELKHYVSCDLVSSRDSDVF